ncbi:MAG: helix-turn-helix transcriptional regulator [Candidatus Pseudoruminococcus sp.]|nr:helix-turn-helix domain-containing protein [Ruminococcus sp.]MDY2783295.1 helix-turn-helix transcriptional regulator [Candidatus Pseudoruminococcus sp.]
MQISLKAARVNAELSQQSVANMLKISKSTLISWEKGRTSPDVLQMQKLCEIYQMPLNNIILQSKST